MHKKDLYFSLYVNDELENDIEIKGTFNTIEELRKYLEVSTHFLYENGIHKKKNLKISFKLNDTTYTIIVDKD